MKCRLKCCKFSMWYKKMNKSGMLLSRKKIRKCWFEKKMSIDREKNDYKNTIYNPFFKLYLMAQVIWICLI